MTQRENGIVQHVVSCPNYLQKKERGNERKERTLCMSCNITTVLIVSYLEFLIIDTV